ncbi:hypothetical protein ACFWXK_25260 [Streptomyces sp. NPDC059070]|uniref:hypothetical protein n=1 Tax=Streptomyces sp. NPDC059070 TaxID=3346713 RepID=UPI0036CF42CA
MEGISPYEEELWDDDFDEDWYTEPSVTYREAVDTLRNLVSGRTDVHVDWNGGRGREDARVVFSDAGGLRVRLGSAAQLSAITRLISSGIPLPSCHAVWYPQEKVIWARLLGDFDQVHNFLARDVPPRKRRTIDPASALGRDLAGLLAEVGAFRVNEGAHRPGGPHRTMRLVSVPPDLSLLYGARNGSGLSLALELSGVTALSAADAEKELISYGTSYMFSLGKATGASLRLWNTEYRVGSRREPSYSGKVRFPRRQYDAHPAELYGAGNSLGRDPIERYLKYYQVLEFYMPKAVDAAISAHGATTPNQVRSPFTRPAGSDRLNIEQNALDTVIHLAVSQAQLANLLRDSDLFAALSSAQVIKSVRALAPGPAGGPDASHDYRGDVSTRVYGIRNRIVHMKEGAVERASRSSPRTAAKRATSPPTSD